jgi:hypothetical protein
MLLNCPQCEKPLKAEDISIENMMAKCRNCDHLFFFDQKGNRDGIPLQKQVLELPDGMSIRKMISQLEIRYSWRRNANGFLIFFAILWNLFLLPFVIIALTQWEWIILLFLSLHLLVGVGLIYYLLATLFNATYITVSPRILRVEVTPLPIPMQASRTLSADQIEQVYVKKYSSGKTNGEPTWAYAVEVILKNQANVRLVGGLKTADYGLYIEQEIEKYLHIDDRRVKAEWSGNYA